MTIGRGAQCNCARPRQKASDRNGQKALGAAAAAPEGPPGAVGAPGPAVAGTRRPPTSGWGPRLGQRQRPCLAARAARRAAAKHHFIGWVSASTSKIYVSSTARWFQPHQARTTVSKLPHDGLDLARETHDWSIPDWHCAAVLRRTRRGQTSDRFQ